MDYIIRICGEAGQGIQTIGGTLAKVFSGLGLYVFTHQDYESRIRGGHNFFQIRFSDKPVFSPKEKIDILIAFDKESISEDAKNISEFGFLIYDSVLLKQKLEKENFLDIPFETLAIKHGGSKIMANVVAVGVVLGMLKLDLDPLSEIIKSEFKKKGEEIINQNIESAKAGFEFAVLTCKSCAFYIPAKADKKTIISGSSAIGLGAIASGCRFYSAYPMTPSTGIMNYIATKAKEYGIIVEQAEDEISAINMALGASFGGVRAMTGTSGGGFALMVEGLSLAAMTETPVVIALAQRPGPATGLPTKTEQADLNFALYTSHGEFPRVIFAPGTPEQAFYLTNKAFELAEKYQIPVIIMSDQHLADSEFSYNEFNTDKLIYNNYRLGKEELEKLQEYKRHKFTENGISPLAIPGESKHVVVTDSDEHDEDGHLIEDADTRIKMVKKRLFDKLPLIKKEIEPPLFYGSNNPDIVLIGWGSNYGVIREVVDALLKEKNIAMMFFSEIYPLPDGNYMDILKNAKKTICIENNATGQFAKIFRAETGFEFKEKISKYDGRPFTLEVLLGEINVKLG